MLRCNATMRFWKEANKARGLHCFISIAVPIIRVIVLSGFVSVWFTLSIYLLKVWIRVIAVWFKLLTYLLKAWSRVISVWLTWSIHLLRGSGSILWFIRCIPHYYLTACVILVRVMKRWLR